MADNEIKIKKPKHGASKQTNRDQIKVKSKFSKNAKHERVPVVSRKPKLKIRWIIVILGIVLIFLVITGYHALNDDSNGGNLGFNHSLTKGQYKENKNVTDVNNADINVATRYSSSDEISSNSSDYKKNLDNIKTRNGKTDQEIKSNDDKKIDWKPDKNMHFSSRNEAADYIKKNKDKIAALYSGVNVIHHLDGDYYTVEYPEKNEKVK